MASITSLRPPAREGAARPRPGTAPGRSTLLSGDALQKTDFKGPAGEIKIDANRNGVGTTYITEVTKAPDGSFYNKVVKTVPNISQTLGLPEADFKKMGLGSRDVPDCRT